MNLLIDGYNLLHVTGIFGKGGGPGIFQRSREALLRFVAASLEDKLRPNTTVVFDAVDAPPGLPDTLHHEEMLVRYARGYPDADTLIEELIQQETVPRKLLVVSSDHRIQRAARKRRARSIDSDLWYAEIWKRRAANRKRSGQALPEKPLGQLSASEVEYWVAEFSAEPAEEDSSSSRPSRRSPTSTTDSDNPFPPGYGEDLLEGE